MADDLTVEILKQIRDGVGALRGDMNERLGVLTADMEAMRTDLNERIDRTNQRLDENNLRLERVEHGLNDLGTFMRQIAPDQARHERFHAEHLTVLEKDVADLKHRFSVSRTAPAPDPGVAGSIRAATGRCQRCGRPPR
jgi:hypothetical protein